MTESTLITIYKDFYMHYRENDSYYVLADEHHNDFEVICILEGKIEVTINSKTYIAGPNSIIVLNNLEFHRIAVLEYPYRRFVVTFKKSILSLLSGEPVLTSVYNYRPRGFNHIIRLTEESAPEIHGLFQNMYQEYSASRAYWENTVRMLVGQLTICLYRLSESSFPLSNFNNAINKKIISDIQDYIDEHYMDDITLKDISSQFHVNMYYLCHLFKDFTDSTLKNYLVSRRISCAKDMLSYTNKEVAVIAAEVGFNSSNNFIKVFKKIVSLTPYQYRKNFSRKAISVSESVNRDAIIQG